MHFACGQLGDRKACSPNIYTASHRLQKQKGSNAQGGGVGKQAVSSHSWKWHKWQVSNYVKIIWLLSTSCSNSFWQRTRVQPATSQPSTGPLHTIIPTKDRKSHPPAAAAGRDNNLSCSARWALETFFRACIPSGQYTNTQVDRLTTKTQAPAAATMVARGSSKGGQHSCRVYVQRNVAGHMKTRFVVTHQKHKKKA